MNDNNQIIIDTLERINACVQRDPNAITSTDSGNVAPEQAYIELVRKVLELAK